MSRGGYAYLISTGRGPLPRSALSSSYLEEPAFSAAYLQYFVPVNLAKIQVLLGEMPPPQSGQRFSVLDVGSGPGTGSLAILDWWTHHQFMSELSVVALDSVPAALRQAEELWERYRRAACILTAELHTYGENLERGVWLKQISPKAPFDLIILANCLNELYTAADDSVAARTTLVAELLKQLAPQGTLMIVEPALRDTSRALHEMRDRLLRENRCTVYSPCLHEQACPVLVNPHDWCHEERAWESPASIREIDKKVGLIKDALKFSYLLLRKDGKQIVERGKNVFRVVSELRAMKGEKRAWLCNAQGRQEVGRQDRFASTKNQALDQWRRGDIIHIAKIAHKERKGTLSALGRVEQEGEVRIVRPV